MIFIIKNKFLTIVTNVPIILFCSSYTSFPEKPTKTTENGCRKSFNEHCGRRTGATRQSRPDRHQSRSGRQPIIALITWLVEPQYT